MDAGANRTRIDMPIPSVAGQISPPTIAQDVLCGVGVYVVGAVVP
jgi:hypothetical protein